MYSENFAKSIKAVEEAREKNIALEPRRMTAQEKEDLLKAYHPDYKTDEFEALTIGPNKGDKVPKELAKMLQAHSRAHSMVSQPTEHTHSTTKKQHLLLNPKNRQVCPTILNHPKNCLHHL